MQMLVDVELIDSGIFVSMICFVHHGRNKLRS